MIPLQLPPQSLRFPVCDFVHQGPEAVAVVHFDGVAEFVQENIVDQVPGEEHQGEGQVDAAAGRTTAPMAFAVEYFDSRTGEAVLGRQIEQA